MGSEERKEQRKSIKNVKKRGNPCSVETFLKGTQLWLKLSDVLIELDYWHILQQTKIQSIMKVCETGEQK